MTNAELVRRYVAALIDNNTDVLSAICAASRGSRLGWAEQAPSLRGGHQRSRPEGAKAIIRSILCRCSEDPE